MIGHRFASKRCRAAESDVNRKHSPLPLGAAPLSTGLTVRPIHAGTVKTLDDDIKVLVLTGNHREGAKSDGKYGRALSQ